MKDFRVDERAGIDTSVLIMASSTAVSFLGVDVTLGMRKAIIYSSEWKHILVQLSFAFFSVSFAPKPMQCCIRSTLRLARMWKRSVKRQFVGGVRERDRLGRCHEGCNAGPT